jgi:hypothetical protein
MPQKSASAPSVGPESCLAQMLVNGEREGRGGDQKSKSSDTTLKTLNDLGRTRDQSLKWQQLAAADVAIRRKRWPRPAAKGHWAEGVRVRVSDVTDRSRHCRGDSRPQTMPGRKCSGGILRRMAFLGAETRSAAFSGVRWGIILPPSAPASGVLAGGGALLDDAGDVLQPPGGTAAGPQRPAVQRSGNSPQGLATMTQTADFRQHFLFAGIRLDVLLVGAQTVPEPDVAHPLALAPFVMKRVPRAFPDGFAFPLGDGGHDVQNQPSGRRAGVEGFRPRKSKRRRAVRSAVMPRV